MIFDMGCHICCGALIGKILRTQTTVHSSALLLILLYKFPSAEGNPKYFQTLLFALGRRRSSIELGSDRIVAILKLIAE